MAEVHRPEEDLFRSSKAPINEEKGKVVLPIDSIMPLTTSISHDL